MVTSANTPPPKLLGPVRSLCPLVESVLRFNADSNLNLNRETVSGTWNTPTKLPIGFCNISGVPLYKSVEGLFAS